MGTISSVAMLPSTEAENARGVILGAALAAMDAEPVVHAAARPQRQRGTDAPPSLLSR
jgi:hypothetical protein